MNNATRTAMTLTEYTEALAAAVTAAGERAHAWHGAKAHRIYRGEDYVEVYECTDDTGGYGPIVGRDHRFGAALRDAERALGEVTIIQPAETAQTSPTPAAVFGSQFGKCAECDGPTRNGAHVLRVDSSGLRGWCCARCAALRPESRSFA